MDKELKEKMEKVLDKMLEKLSTSMDEVNKKMEEALKEPCKIHITGDGKGTKLECEGGRLTLLVTLAGAEKNILKDLHCSEMEFDAIKSMVGSEKTDDDVEVL